MCSNKNRELGRFYIIYICKLYWKSCFRSCWKLPIEAEMFHSGLSNFSSFPTTHQLIFYHLLGGEVKHNGKTYLLYLWSEKIYLCEKPKKNSDKAKKVMSCYICMIEFGNLEAYTENEIIPLVLYSRDEVINGPKKHNNLKDHWEPRLFSFQPIE